jgi:hypothetical protein
MALDGPGLHRVAAHAELMLVYFIVSNWSLPMAARPGVRHGLPLCAVEFVLKHRY